MLHLKRRKERPSRKESSAQSSLHYNKPIYLGGGGTLPLTVEPTYHTVKTLFIIPVAMGRGTDPEKKAVPRALQIMTSRSILGGRVHPTPNSTLPLTVDPTYRIKLTSSYLQRWKERRIQKGQQRPELRRVVLQRRAREQVHVLALESAQVVRERRVLIQEENEEGWGCKTKQTMDVVSMSFVCISKSKTPTCGWVARVLAPSECAC